MEQPKIQNPKTHVPRTALFIAVLAALVVLAVRGPIFGLKHGDDFILIYSPTRALLMGSDPYDAAAVDAVWLNGGGSYESRPSLREDGALIYPPTTLALLAPFAALPWSIAKPLWIFSNVAFLGIVLWAVARLAGLGRRQNRTWIFVALALTFMPVHTALRHGQTPIMVLALIVVGFAIADRREPSRCRSPIVEVVSGVILSVSALLKPQIGLPFVALQGLRRRWSVIGAAIVSMVVVAAAAVVPMMARGIPWWANWKLNLASFTAGNVGDPTLANPVRHQLLNLHVPLHAFIESRAVVNALVLLIVGALATAFFRFWILDFGLWIVGRGRAEESGGQPADPGPRAALARLGDDSTQNRLLLSLSMVAVLSLLIVYHRFYDAVLLLLPLAWAIDAVSRQPRQIIGWLVLALTVPFFLNAGTALSVLESRAALPAWMLDQWWWNGVIMPVQSWSLVLMAVCLIAANERRTTEQLK